LVAALAAIGGAVVARLIGWWQQRRRDQAAAAAWQAKAGAEERRATAAEAVIEAQADAAARTQTALEKELADAAQARIDHGDAGARRRVQERWARAGADPAGDPVGGAAAVRDPAAPGAGSDPDRGASVRGRR